MTTVAIILASVAVGALAAAWSFHRRCARAEARRAAEARDFEEEREQHAHVLAAESARTSALFDRMVEGVILLDEEGSVRLANPAAAGLFKFETQSVIGRTLLEATRHHEIAAIVQGLAGRPELLEQELRVERDAEPRIVQVNAVALSDVAGQRNGALLVFHDVTRLRQLESIRQDFVANVSHELRTPLSLIKSAAETLIDGGRNDPGVTVRFLDIIDKHANRLTLLIDDLLLLARLDSGRLELKLQPVPLRHAAGEALDDAARPAQAREIRLHNNVPSDLAAKADPNRLRQVLANLIDNAIKYGRVGGEVVVDARALAAGGIEVGVRDDGPGISGEASARVFERFYRVDKARAREQGGTGLGLAIVKNVVEAHGGSVRVESAPGEGTTFYFTLPTPSPAERAAKGAR